MATVESMPEVQETRSDQLNLLIVDDERTVREGCREVAQSLSLTTFVAENMDLAFRILDAQAIDVVLLDLPSGSGGLEVLQEVKRRRPEAEVIVMTSHATVQAAVQAMKMGAYDYVPKPFNLEELKLLLQRVGQHLRLTTECRVLREKVRSRLGFGNIIGHAPEMERLYRMIAKVARSTHPVLIIGESGTGKELVARCIHNSGPFRDKPFLPVDCGSLVPTLIESELFGYVRGAFTGAVRSKEGLLSVAEGGTVFLDEIAELPVDLQAKLLRALQEKEIRPVGSTRRIPINVRILAASNRNLEQAVEEGKFRKDLYFRLNVVALKLPPLRERKQDIPMLVTHFLEKMAASGGKMRTLSDEALKLMLAHDWPGNVREVENALERASALSTGPLIQACDLPTALQQCQTQPGLPITAGKIIPMAELEKQAILNTIAQLNGDKLMAARLLGIGKTTLYRKLKEYASRQ